MVLVSQLCTKAIWTIFAIKFVIMMRKLVKMERDVLLCYHAYPSLLGNI